MFLQVSHPLGNLNVSQVPNEEESSCQRIHKIVFKVIRSKFRRPKDRIGVLFKTFPSFSLDDIKNVFVWIRLRGTSGDSEFRTNTDELLEHLLSDLVGGCSRVVVYIWSFDDYSFGVQLEHRSYY
jgi:hypothetical protein